MSVSPSKSDWLEKTLESTRRDVRQLEIDACRIRTDLARLEAANAVGVIEGDVAEPLRDVETDVSHGSSRSEQALAPLTGLAGAEPLVSNGAPDAELDWQPAASPLPDGMQILVGTPAKDETAADADVGVDAAEEPDVAESLPIAELTEALPNNYRRATPPVMASLTLHGLILFLTVSITVGTIHRDDPRFAQTVLSLGEKPARESEVFEPKQLADLGEAAVQNAVADAPKFDAIASASHAEIPIDFKSADGPASPGRVGVPEAIPTDLGTLMTGVGGLSADGIGAPTGLGDGNQRGRGGGGRTGATSRNGARPESTLFFGTEARGDRFVFVVDNSSSMKGGRLEMAEKELVKTIEGLSAKQSFYVIFVSDQTYPMFYPQRETGLVPATPANKKRLTEWVPKAILASGKNRELIKAMDLAASLDPQAVYLLWDGDLRYSEKVRLDVIMHLTQPNQWKFVLHTLGMGITSADSEQNLRMIASAHHGIYRRIDVPPARAR